MNKLLCACVLAAIPGVASATTYFKNTNDNGLFTPFNSSTPAGVRYGDGGWLSDFQPGGFTLTGITLGLAAFGGTANGTTDITFTFNDGDPSGLVFGTGNTLYSTTITNVQLIADEASPATLFDLYIPLPSIVTAGGFNNIGFSIGVSNFNFDGQFGFQCSSAFGQQIGFYTNNASYYSGSNWSLFSFGPGAFGVGNFVAEIVPSPASGMTLAGACLLAARRRRG